MPPKTGKAGPKTDPKERVKLLKEKYNWDDNAARKIWCWGPETEGANVVVDPRVKGTMTLTSTVAVSPAQAMRLFSAQLRTQGFALVENAGIHTVVPEADAKLQSGPVNAGQPSTSGGQASLAQRTAICCSAPSVFITSQHAPSST